MDSIQVVPGQMVARHAILGMGESSGNSTGPHLHQEFRKPRKGRLWPEKFPGVDGACDDPDVPWAVSFADVPEVDGVPVSGETYTSLNGPEAVPPP